jgi:hypothetical protein
MVHFFCLSNGSRFASFRFEAKKIERNRRTLLPHAKSSSIHWQIMYITLYAHLKTLENLLYASWAICVLLTVKGLSEQKVLLQRKVCINYILIFIFF